MKKTIVGLVAAVAGSLAFAAAPVQLDTVWNWSYTGNGVSASGQWDTLGNASSPTSLQWITGTYSDASVTNGTIDGLVPLGSDGAWIYDNAFGGAGVVSNPGVLFDVNGGAVHVNLFSDGSSPTGFLSGTNWNGGGYALTPVQLSVTAVPEPAIAALLLAGIGALGFTARRKRVA